jgi:hypothetical protein
MAGKKIKVPARESKYLDMFADLAQAVNSIRAKYGNDNPAGADMLMAMCLAVAQLCADENVPAEIALGYVVNFMPIVNSIAGKEGAQPMEELIGQGGN